MKKCKCWEIKYQIVGWYDAETPIFSNNPIQRCNGTKEREECSCDGDESKCNFYPEKRKKSKTMSTTEMSKQRQLRTMAKSEAEKRFNIKIVGD